MLMSGSGLAPWSLIGDPAHYAAIVANHVNCSVELPHQALLNCFRGTPLPNILSISYKDPDFGHAFGPSIDGVVIGEEMTRNYLRFEL
jgi:neuroligin